MHLMTFFLSIASTKPFRVKFLPIFIGESINFALTYFLEHKW